MRPDISIRTTLSKQERLLANLRGFRVHIREVEREMIKQEAALAARAFIKFSPPIPMGGGLGDSRKAKLQGMEAVERDIRSMFAPLNATLRAAIDPTYGGMKEFMAWRDRPLRGGKVSAVLEAIHQDPIPERALNKARNLYLGRGREFGSSYVLTDMGEIRGKHQEQRKAYRGRITRKGGPDEQIKRHPYFAEPRMLDRYIKAQQDLVGTLQSGWLRVITSIGTIRIKGQYLISAQKGLQKHLYRLAGRGEVRYSANFFGKFTGMSPADFIVIRNPMGNVNGVGDESAIKMKVINYRMDQISLRPYQRKMSDSIRVWNQGGRPTI